MNELLGKLRNMFPSHEFKKSDIEILDSCIFGYNENDIIWACKQLFKDKKNKTIKAFYNKEIFIKYRNMNREYFPNWVDNLTKDDQYDLKENYKNIISYCFKNWDQYNCKHPDILELIQAYHKEGIPYWCISAYIQEKINLTGQNYYIKKEQLLEIMNKGESFKEGCRVIFKKKKQFKEMLKKEGISFVESVGLKA